MNHPTDTPIKLLVVGDVEGQFAGFIKKINGLVQKAGPFECVFCVGEFFGKSKDAQHEALMNGDLVSSIPIYVMGSSFGSSVETYDYERLNSVENVTYLGQKGVITLASGLTVAFLSGQESAAHPVPSTCYFNQSTAADLESSVLASTSATGSPGIDLLLTSQWPADVAVYNVQAAPDAKQMIPPPSELIAKLAMRIRPRYHFVALSGHYFERQPYRNHRVLMDAAAHVTRFIALARFGNAHKHKHLYAFNIVPMKHCARSKLVEQAPDTTEPPYGRVVDELARKAQAEKEAKGDGVTQYFFNMKANMHDDGGGKRKNRKRGQDDFHTGPSKGGPREPKVPSKPCWFCLSSQEVEKHLIISVGDSVYLALAKGGLTPENVLILPVAHVQSISAAPDDALLMELERYLDALRDAFEAQRKCCVFFERNFRTSHAQIQVFPIPNSVDMDKLEELFREGAERHGLQLAEIPCDTKITDIVNEGVPYFWLELPPSRKRYFCKITDKQFPLSFGRDILAGKRVLNIPDREDWRNCVVSNEEETKLVDSFKSIFTPYDFNDLSDEESDGDDDDGNDK